MAGEIKLMFVTDLHGSEIVYRKALNTAKMHNVDYLIIGGDITSKNIVFIERSGDKYYFNGNEVDIKLFMRMQENMGTISTWLAKMKYRKF
jgi:Predicted phosphoesterases, related to the Icc protein